MDSTPISSVSRSIVPPPTSRARTPQPPAEGVDGSPAPLPGVHPAVRRDTKAFTDVIEFRDDETGEVLHQLPAKAVLAVIAAAQAAARKEAGPR